MAMDLAALHFNAKEEPDFSKFIVERVIEEVALEAIHGPIMTGLTMKQQIVFASQFGLSGILDSGCARPESGAKTTLTEKFWEPEPVGDTFPICQADYNQLFKAAFDKISSYKERFDITGSDEQMFLATMIATAASQMIRRLAWNGDKDVAEATATDAGLISAANVKFFNPINGLWKQIFADTAIPVISLEENAQVTVALQTTLAPGRSVEIFKQMSAAADERLTSDPTAIIMVNRGLFENYRDWLQSQTLPFSPDLTMKGMPMLEWDGHKVINMSAVWDVYNKYFVNNTENNARWRPNRALMTVPANIPIGTLNDGDFTELDSHFEWKERKFYTAYGMTLDAKHLESYMTVAAY